MNIDKHTINVMVLDETIGRGTNFVVNVSPGTGAVGKLEKAFGMVISDFMGQEPKETQDGDN